MTVVCEDLQATLCRMGRMWHLMQRDHVHTSSLKQFLPKSLDVLFDTDSVILKFGKSKACRPAFLAADVGETASSASMEPSLPSRIRDTLGVPLTSDTLGLFLIDPRGRTRGWRRGGWQSSLCSATEESIAAKQIRWCKPRGERIEAHVLPITEAGPDAGEDSQEQRIVHEALKLINKAPVLPSLVVFDLDHTLWPFYCQYRRKGDTPALFPQVAAILKALAMSNVAMAVASRTPSQEVALAMLDKLSLAHHFVAQEIYFTLFSKTKHLAAISQKTGVPYSTMLFFDDEAKNVITAGQLGVTAVLLNNGLDLMGLETGLTMLATRPKVLLWHGYGNLNQSLVKEYLSMLPRVVMTIKADTVIHQYRITEHHMHLQAVLNSKE